MKRLVLLFTVALFVIALATSCKSTDCPAYSNADTTVEETNA